MIHSEVVFKDFESAKRAKNLVKEMLSNGEQSVSVDDLKNSLKGDFEEQYMVLAGVDAEIDKEYYWNTKNVKIHEKEIDGKKFYAFEEPKAPDVL